MLYFMELGEVSGLEESGVSQTDEKDRPWYDRKTTFILTLKSCSLIRIVGMTSPLLHKPTSLDILSSVLPPISNLQAFERHESFFRDFVLEIHFISPYFMKKNDHLSDCLKSSSTYMIGNE